MPLIDPSQDLALLTAMRAGGDGVAAANAFNTLYRRHQAPLYRYALLRSGRADVAADVMQDVFLALMTNSLKFDPARGALQPFLFGVARNLLLKRDEAARRYVSTATGEDDELANDFAADGAPSPEQRVLANESAEQVRRALGQLAPHYRDVLILYEIHDLSYLEISHICGIDLGTVRSRLSRARAKLTELLTPADTAQCESTRRADEIHSRIDAQTPLVTAFAHTNNDKLQRDYDHG
jgi:RNA polymerase sigma-70 factor, ECF subfamily